MKILNRSLSINSTHYKKIIELINNAGAEARPVGGVVRDALLGIESSDIDIATGLTPAQVMDFLSSHNIRIIPTGIKYGTVTALIDNEKFEITTLRKDISCNGRHAEVAYTDDFQEDAARRDFTINALSYCPLKKKIYDYFNGLADIKERNVKFIGIASERIKEDYLRILRFFRFSFRFSDHLDEEGVKACAEHKSRLINLSRERVKTEFDRILMLGNRVKCIESLQDLGILQILFPTIECKTDYLIEVEKALAVYKVEPINALLYAAIFFNDRNLSVRDLLDLKFSKIESNNIVRLIKLGRDIINWDQTKVKIMLTKLWLKEKYYPEYFIFASMLLNGPNFIHELYNFLNSKNTRPVFPVKGTDLIQLGFRGAVIGNLINYGEEEWLASDFSLSKTQIINLIKNYEK